MFAKESYLHELQDPKLKAHKPYKPPQRIQEV